MAYIGALTGSTSGTTGQTGPVDFSRISGLASGLDTDSIVNGLVQANQAPLVSLLQQRQLLLWKQADYQRVYSSLSDLRNSLFSMKLQSTYLAQTVSSTAPSLVTGAGGPSTPGGSYSITVSRLAQGATAASSSVLSTDPNYGNTALSALGVTGTANLTINGENFSFDSSKTINDVLSAISGDLKSGVTAFYDPNAGRVVLQTTATGSGAKIQVTNDSAGLFSNVFKINPAADLSAKPTLNGSNLANAGVVEINGVRFQFNTGMTVTDVVNAINAQTSTTGVTAAYDSTSGTLTLSGGGTLYSPISVYDPNNVLGFAGQPQATGTAVDAVYTVNGFTTTSSTNNPTYNGLSLNLLGVTGSTPVTLTVGPDVNTVVQNIENFISQYNKTMQLMQKLYGETRNYDYQPLTSAQAAQMTQTQIDQWNLKAQSGMLAHDMLLGSAMDNLMNDAQAVVGGQPNVTINGSTVNLNSLAAIGITTIDPLYGPAAGSTAPGVDFSSFGWGSNGLLQVDTTKLTAALQANPQAVMRLFTNDPSLTGSSDTSQTGIAVQLYNAVNSAMDQIKQEADVNQATLSSSSDTSGQTPLPYTPVDPNGDLNALFAADSLNTSFIGQQLRDMDQRSLDMQQQLSDLRQRYYDEFTQMEEALAQLNSQSAYLSSMLGQG